MKKHFCLLALAAIVLFSSCKKDQENLILGTWAMDCQASTTHEEYASPNPSDCWTSDYTVLSTGIDAIEFSFGEDSLSVLSVIRNEGSYTDVMPYTFSESTLTIGKDEIYTVTQLDEKSLILDGTDTEQNGEDTYSYKVHYVFSRK